MDPGVQWLLCETAAARRETARDGGCEWQDSQAFEVSWIFCLVKKLDTKFMFGE